jgi:hypothetical protein
MTLDNDSFLARFEAAEGLQEGLRRRLSDTTAARPHSGNKQALGIWLEQITKDLSDHRRWGEAFVRLIDSAPPQVLERHPEIVDSRRFAQDTLLNLNRQLRQLGIELPDNES